MSQNVNARVATFPDNAIAIGEEERGPSSCPIEGKLATLLEVL